MADISLCVSGNIAGAVKFSRGEVNLSGNASESLRGLDFPQETCHSAALSMSGAQRVRQLSGNREFRENAHP
jgi:hypothetical protein